jgi:hypothetical protein
MFDVFYIGTKPNLFAHEQQVDSIKQAQQLTRTRFFWMVSYLVDYTGFDFLYEPLPWQAHQCHAWPSQWQKDSGTYLVPKLGYADTNYHPGPVVARQEDLTAWNDTSFKNFDYSWHPDPSDPAYIYQFATQHQKTGGPVYTVPGATEVKYLAELKIQTVGNATAIYEIDHLNGAEGQIPNTTRRVRYFDNYRDTLIRIAKSIGTEHEYVWICSSICDYTGFDFTWHPEQWQATMLHVFASNDQKFGDTFFMHVPTFAEYAERKALLEWYDLNFVDKIVPRRSIPVIEHAEDSNVDAVKTAEWSGPVALFTTNGLPMTIPAVNLWRSETKAITPLSSGASAVVVPRVAVPYIKTQLYDYPYIDKKQQQRHGDPNLDIVFISNGEPNLENNLNHLEKVVSLNGINRNQIHHIKNVNGRVASQHAAANASTTPWYYAVWAKLEVSSEFDWSWQPDRMQQPKHYIFHARNPVNGLEYGHQGMIAYNKQLVLETQGKELDFTMEKLHEVVPLLSGTAYYNNDKWTAWRTAFREVLKLRDNLPDVESEYRLNKWLNFNNTDQHIVNEEWSRWGADDALEYYDEVAGEFDQLKKSYEWKWLASYAFIKRGLITVD